MTNRKQDKQDKQASKERSVILHSRKFLRNLKGLIVRINKDLDSSKEYERQKSSLSVVVMEKYFNEQFVKDMSEYVIKYEQQLAADMVDKH